MRMNKQHPMCKVISAWWVARGLPERFAKFYKQQLRHRLIEMAPDALVRLDAITDTSLRAAFQKISRQCKPYEQVRQEILTKLN